MAETGHRIRLSVFDGSSCFHVKVLLYTQWCTPEPAFKSVPFARALVERGHEVRVLTGFPNYPGGRLFPGYRLRPWQRETLEGIHVYRAPLYPSHDGSTMRRAVNYASFGIASSVLLLLGWKPDVVCVYNLVTLGAVARLGRWFRGVPFVIDVQDLWPESILQSGMGASWMRRPIRYICDFAYRGADKIVAQSDGFRDELIRRGVEPRKIEVIHNWIDEGGLLRPTAEPGLDKQEDLKLRGRFNIVYAGNLGAAQGLENAIRAASITSQLDPQIQWVFVGNGVKKESLMAMASDIAPLSTLFLPARPQSAMSALACRADVLLIHLKDSDLFTITIPSKVQSCLALGRPVLAAISGDAARLVERSGAGVVCDPGQPDRLAQAAQVMARFGRTELEAMGAKGRSFYLQELSMAKGVVRFEQVLLDAVRERTVAVGDKTDSARLWGGLER